VDLRAAPMEQIRKTVRLMASERDKLYPPPVIEGLRTEDRDIPTVNQDTIAIRVYKMDSFYGKKSPVVVLYVPVFKNADLSYHGGGFVFGNIDAEDGKRYHFRDLT
jgi:hypothetical protein